MGILPYARRPAVVRCYPLPARHCPAGILRNQKEENYLMENITELISSVGFPAALVLILLLFLWRVCRYVAPLGRQVVNEHLEFVRHTMEHQEHQTQSLSKQTQMIEALSSTVKSALQPNQDGH